MTFKNLSFFPRRAAAERRGDADKGAAMIVVLMMSLVFVPVAVAHAATLVSGKLAGIGTPQLAGIVQLILPAVPGIN
jgi:hypothetical protein